ncbi:MAG: AAA family ATPase [Planctomycetales bacterium]|nr:AAA family ATPase [Planctomycetales bacterium]
MSQEEIAGAVNALHANYERVRQQLGGVIVGMEEITEQLMIGILCRGHCIVQGMPGLAKTLLISQLASLMDLSFVRIQFTPDLMPADITGGDVLEEDRTTGRREFRFIKGPLFHNLVLADEINRTPPKTQSALLEAMEERQISISGETYQLPKPFFVLATQNPVEVEGTYPLPEAQLDRFLMKIKVDYPSLDEEREICRRQTTDYSFTPERVVDSQTLQSMQELVPKVVVADHVYDAAIHLARASRPEEGQLPANVREMVQYGAGPRASIALLNAAKARALLNKRYHATSQDVYEVATPVLRHRIIPTFNAEASGVDTDEIIRTLVQDIAGSMREAG